MECRSVGVDPRLLGISHFPNFSSVGFDLKNFIEVGSSAIKKLAISLPLDEQTVDILGSERPQEIALGAENQNPSGRVRGRVNVATTVHRDSPVHGTVRLIIRLSGKESGGNCELRLLTSESRDQERRAREQ